MKDRFRLVELAERLRQAGYTREAILTGLREAGASQTDCVLVIMRLEGLDLTAAGGVIDDSETWADMRAANADVRESFWHALEQLAEENR